MIFCDKRKPETKQNTNKHEFFQNSNKQELSYTKNYLPLIPYECNFHFIFNLILKTVSL